MPIGEEFGGATYFMLETHYDNPAVDQDLVDTSGMRIFYTDDLREHDTGMILVGTEVNFLHVIPPFQKDFQTLGRCTSECTRKGLPPDGIHLLSGVLHSHLASRKMRLRHLRNGRELPTIMEDNNYDFNFQSSRSPKHEVLIKPGDELLLECDYETSERPNPTFGGLSTREEMCLGFMLYYPRQQLADCRSLPSVDTLLSALGIESFHGQAFGKLLAFMKAIGRTDIDGEKTLTELLTILDMETGQKMLSNDQKTEVRLDVPISEEDLLKKPFYTVEEPSPTQSFDTTLKNLPQGSNYRNLLFDMLLNIKIKAPAVYENKTFQEHFMSIDWKNEKVSKLVQEALYFGKHSSVCLAHGRRSIIPVSLSTVHHSMT